MIASFQSEPSDDPFAICLNPDRAPNASHKCGDNVAEEGDLKKRLIAVGLGILVLGIVFGLGLLSSGDIRVIYIAGAVALLGGAVWLGASGRPDWIAAGLLVLPLFAVFGFVVLAQIPGLWVHAVFLGNRGNRRSICSQSDPRTRVARPHRRHRFGRAACLFGMVLHFLFSKTAGGQP